MFIYIHFHFSKCIYVDGSKRIAFNDPTATPMWNGYANPVYTDVESVLAVHLVCNTDSENSRGLIRIQKKVSLNLTALSLLHDGICLSNVWRFRIFTACNIFYNTVESFKLL